MKKITLIVLISVSICSCNFISEPEFKKVENIKLLKAEGDKIVFSANAVYYNPSIFTITIKNLDLDVYLNNDNIGKVNQDVSLNLKSKEETTIPIELKLYQKDVMAQFLNSLISMSANNKSKFSFKGTSDASILCFPKKSEVDFETELELNIASLFK